MTTIDRHPTDAANLGEARAAAGPQRRGIARRARCAAVGLLVAATPLAACGGGGAGASDGEAYTPDGTLFMHGPVLELETAGGRLWGVSGRDEQRVFGLTPAAWGSSEDDDDVVVLDVTPELGSSSQHRSTLATHGDSLWVANRYLTPCLSEFDASTGELRREYELDDAVRCGELHHGHGALWMLSTDVGNQPKRRQDGSKVLDTLSRIDPESGEATVVELDEPINGMAMTDEGVVVVRMERIERLDPSSMEVLASVDVSEVRGGSSDSIFTGAIDVTSSGIWVGLSGAEYRYLRLDPGDFSALGGVPDDLAVEAGGISHGPVEHDGRIWAVENLGYMISWPVDAGFEPELEVLDRNIRSSSVAFQDGILIAAGGQLYAADTDGFALVRPAEREVTDRFS